MASTDLKKMAGTEYLEKPNFDGFILIGAQLSVHMCHICKMRKKFTKRKF